MILQELATANVIFCLTITKENKKIIFKERLCPDYSFFFPHIFSKEILLIYFLLLQNLYQSFSRNSRGLWNDNHRGNWDIHCHLRKDRRQDKILYFYQNALIQASTELIPLKNSKETNFMLEEILTSKLLLISKIIPTSNVISSMVKWS